MARVYAVYAHRCSCAECSARGDRRRGSPVVATARSLSRSRTATSPSRCTLCTRCVTTKGDRSCLAAAAFPLSLSPTGDTATGDRAQLASPRVPPLPPRTRDPCTCCVTDSLSPGGVTRPARLAHRFNLDARYLCRGGNVPRLAQPGGSCSPCVSCADTSATWGPPGTLQRDTPTLPRRIIASLICSILVPKTSENRKRRTQGCTPHIESALRKNRVRGQALSCEAE